MSEGRIALGAGGIVRLAWVRETGWLVRKGVDGWIGLGQGGSGW